MSKFLDLSVFEEQYLDVKLADGRLLQLCKPTQAIVINMLKFQNINENTNPNEIIDAVDEITFDILSTDKDGLVVTKETVAEMNLRMKLALIQEYGKFISEVQSNPN